MAGLTVKYKSTPMRRGALAYCLRVEVEEADGIPPEVFVFHRDTRMLATGFPFDYKSGAEFQNVATPVDIEETCTEDGITPRSRFYRARDVELIFRSMSDLETAKTTIDEDLSALVRSWDELGDHNSFESIETRTYGVVESETEEQQQK